MGETDFIGDALYYFSVARIKTQNPASVPRCEHLAFA